MATDRWRSFLDQGTRLAFASDWPCTDPPDPFLGIQQAVTRAEWRSADTESIVGNPFDGAGQGGARRTGKVYVPAERITVEEAVRAYTAGSAYAAFMDDRVGTLEVGKAADLVVLSQDLFSVPPESIAATRAVMTMVGGRIVYRDEDSGPLPRGIRSAFQDQRPTIMTARDADRAQVAQARTPAGVASVARGR